MLVFSLFMDSNSEHHHCALGWASALGTSLLCSRMNDFYTIRICCCFWQIGASDLPSFASRGFEPVPSILTKIILCESCPINPFRLSPKTLMWLKIGLGYLGFFQMMTVWMITLLEFIFVGLNAKFCNPGVLQFQSTLAQIIVHQNLEHICSKLGNV